MIQIFFNTLHPKSISKTGFPENLKKNLWYPYFFLIFFEGIFKLMDCTSLDVNENFLTSNTLISHLYKEISIYVAQEKF